MGDVSSRYRRGKVALVTNVRDSSHGNALFQEQVLVLFKFKSGPHTAVNVFAVWTGPRILLALPPVSIVQCTVCLHGSTDFESQTV